MPSHRARHHSRVTESWQNFVALVSSFSGGHELAFRQALFTAVAHFFLIVVVLICFQLYVILQTFLKPLVWAALTGTILFPLKSYLAHGARGWIEEVKERKTSLFVGIVATPFQLIDSGFNYFGTEVLDFVWNHYSKLCWGAISLLGCFLAQLLLWNHMEGIVRLSQIFGRALGFFSSKAIWLLIFPYILAVNSLWTPQHRQTLRILAWPLWIWLGLHLSSLLGSLAAPVLIVVGVILGLGFVTELKVVKKKIQRAHTVHRLCDHSEAPLDDNPDKSPLDSTFWQVLSSSVHHLVTDSLAEVHEDSRDGHGEYFSEEDVTVSSTPMTTRRCLPGMASPPLLAELKLFGVNKEKQGTRYMLYLFWMFALVEVLTHYYVIPLLLVPVAYRIARVFGQKRGAWTALAQYVQELKNKAKGWVMSRRDIVAPTALRGLVRLAKQGDAKMLTLLEDCVDESVSLLLVLMVFVGMGVSGLIVTMQVQQETVYLVGMSSEFLNETIVNHPEYMQWLPEGAQVQETVRSAMDSVYMYGRDWIVGSLREAISDENATRAGLIEKEILSLADRVYQFYVPRNRSISIPHGMLRQNSIWGNRSLANPLYPLLSEHDDKWWSFHVWAQLNETWYKASGALDWKSATAYIKNNIDTFTSVMESIWGICKGNFAMVFSLITTILSIFLIYFSALVHFIFCGLVYIAALYYLLCSSKDRYRPLDLIGVISPSVAEAGHVAEIIEQTISDIFAASFKMAAFYGFFTWVLLSLFGIYIRFIPSVLASLLAVCPLVPPYVACIPALCELWFLRGEYIPAILMALGAVGPSMFVDIAIYGDVKTAHPYMFALSVAGGIIAMGLEGAVLGPVMLCILLIVVQVYRRILQRSPKPNDPTVPTSLGQALADTLISPTTPDEKKITSDTGINMMNVFNRQESVSTYPAALLAVAEAEVSLLRQTPEPEPLVDSSVDSPSKSFASPNADALSTSRRRERLSSFGSKGGLDRKQSTPKESSSTTAIPDFGQSPVIRTSL
ncbi:Transmembrane protein 245 [Hypsibius exemplaris]|uniref:Transmembrane protein 245 n=1 Tax=Hypsibius exemplaris TaxID=2072580 RepID=A0A1W0WV65_HYPEX|nr:Transmembrane protein 245 [Hypsibius exemplaris]